MFYYFNKFSILLFQLFLTNFTFYCSYHFYDKASDSQINAGIPSIIHCLYDLCPREVKRSPMLVEQNRSSSKHTSEGPLRKSVECQSPGPGGQDHVWWQLRAGAQTLKEEVAHHFQRPDGTRAQTSPAIPLGRLLGSLHGSEGFSFSLS